MIDEAAGKRPEALAGLGPALHQQDVSRMHDQCIDRDEGWRIREAGELCLVLEHEGVLLDDLGERLALGELLKEGVDTVRDGRLDEHPLADGFGRVQGGLVEQVPDFRGLALFVVRRFDEFPLRKHAQVVGARVLVMADQADLRWLRYWRVGPGNELRNLGLDLADPALVVIRKVAQHAEQDPARGLLLQA